VLPFHNKIKLTYLLLDLAIPNSRIYLYNKNIVMNHGIKESNMNFIGEEGLIG